MKKKFGWINLSWMVWAIIQFAGDLGMAGAQKKPHLSNQELAQQEQAAEVGRAAYANSEWNTHGLLPYSKCYISTQPNDLGIDTTAWGLIYEETQLKDKSYLGLHCTSGQKEEYSFSIPLEASNLHHVGVLWNLPLSDRMNEHEVGIMRLILENLKNKTVAQLFGSYTGVAVGLGCCLSAEQGVLTHQGIVMSEGEVSCANCSFELAGVQITLKPSNLCHDKIVIYASGPLNEKGTEHTSVMLEQVNDFKFVHIKSKATTREIDQKLQQVLRRYGM